MRELCSNRFSLEEILVLAGGAIPLAVPFRRRCHSVLDFLSGLNVLGTRLYT